MSSVSMYSSHVQIMWTICNEMMSFSVEQRKKYNLLLNDMTNTQQLYWGDQTQGREAKTTFATHQCADGRLYTTVE